MKSTQTLSANKPLPASPLSVTEGDPSGKKSSGEPGSGLDSEAVFSLNKAQLNYQGHPVLQDLSFTISRGERVALVGKSGAGKSTLLRHLRQLRNEQVAWCPQQTGLVPMLSVYHNIYMGALHRHGNFYNLLNLVKPLKQPLAEVREIAAKLSLEEQLFTSVDRLSGGQQQRTAIGRALYQQRPVLLGDEPVSALDDYQGASLLNLLAHKHDTLVLALHDIKQALRVCSRVIGLKNGRIVLDEQTTELDTSDLAPLYI